MNFELKDIWRLGKQRHEVKRSVIVAKGKAIGWMIKLSDARVASYKCILGRSADAQVDGFGETPEKALDDALEEYRKRIRNPVYELRILNTLLK